MKVSDYNEQDSATDVDESDPTSAAKAFVLSELPYYDGPLHQVYVWNDDGVVHRFRVHVRQTYELDAVEER